MHHGPEHAGCRLQQMRVDDEWINFGQGPDRIGWAGTRLVLLLVLALVLVWWCCCCWCCCCCFCCCYRMLLLLVVVAVCFVVFVVALPLLPWEKPLADFLPAT